MSLAVRSVWAHLGVPMNPCATTEGARTRSPCASSWDTDSLKNPPEHSGLSKTRKRLSVEAHAGGVRPGGGVAAFLGSSERQDSGGGRDDAGGQRGNALDRAARRREGLRGGAGAGGQGVGDRDADAGGLRAHAGDGRTPPRPRSRPGGDPKTDPDSGRRLQPRASDAQPVASYHTRYHGGERAVRWAIEDRTGPAGSEFVASSPGSISSGELVYAAKAQSSKTGGLLARNAPGRRAPTRRRGLDGSRVPFERPVVDGRVRCPGRSRGSLPRPRPEKSGLSGAPGPTCWSTTPRFCRTNQRAPVACAPRSSSTQRTHVPISSGSGWIGGTPANMCALKLT